MLHANVDDDSLRKAGNWQHDVHVQHRVRVRVRAVAVAVVADEGEGEGEAEGGAEEQLQVIDPGFQLPGDDKQSCQISSHLTVLCNTLENEII